MHSTGEIPDMQVRVMLLAIKPVSSFIIQWGKYMLWSMTASRMNLVEGCLTGHAPLILLLNLFVHYSDLVNEGSNTPAPPAASPQSPPVISLMCSTSGELR